MPPSMMTIYIASPDYIYTLLFPNLVLQFVSRLWEIISCRPLFRWNKVPHNCKIPWWKKFQFSSTLLDVSSFTLKLLLSVTKSWAHDKARYILHGMVSSDWYLYSVLGDYYQESILCTLAIIYTCIHGVM